MTVFDKFGNALMEVAPHGNDFQGINLRSAQMQGVELEGACFDDTNLTGANLAGADLYWATFDGAICDGCNFAGASLRGAIFFNGSFSGADFRGADFSNDNLNGSTDLHDIDFSTTLLDGANFTGCTYGSDTIFPNDFDPAERGLVFKSRT